MIIIHLHAVISIPHMGPEAAARELVVHVLQEEGLLLCEVVKVITETNRTEFVGPGSSDFQ